jgi:hypothetical protein
MDTTTYQLACIRIRIEFVEMPGMKLSHAQVRRLCGLSDACCDAALRSLVASGFLARRRDGSFLRNNGDEIAPPMVIGQALESSAA